ncbi:MAG: hypothetical protein LH650_06020 [Chloroflexi bacterium]|nr:hypothetical protein [Chloroflexota bacterium]
MRSGPVTPGMRTDSGRGTGAVVSTAAAVVAADPALWLLGIVGFGVRGGLILLTLPVLTIPSPVLLSILFRNELNTSGTSASFDVLAAAAAALTGIVALLAILISAWAELHSIERCVASPLSGTLRLGRPARRLEPRERSSVLLWVAAVQAAGLMPILLLTFLLVGRIGRLVATELQTPSDLAMPLIARVARDIAPTLLGVLLIVAVIEVLVSVASRRLVIARLGLLPDGAGERTEGRLAIHGALRGVRQPLRVAGVAAMSWATAAVAILVAVGSLSLAWGATRQGLAALGRSGDMGAMLGALIMACLLSVVWIGALCLCGLASAFRGSLWTMDTLR